MMLRLYKFQVCAGEGSIIFAVKDYKEMNAMLGDAIELARSLDFSYSDKDSILTYLGTFMPAIEHPELPYVIDYQTGEY